MKNRNLKKAIRQAFEHATPDLAESIAVSSLLSDNQPRKKDEKPTISDKPIKTPIQFRALATLAASIAVVALLANLISMANPFPSPENPNGSSDTPQSGLTPNDTIDFGTNITLPDTTDPLNTEGPDIGFDSEVPSLSDWDAFEITLDHAGLVKDDIVDYSTHLHSGDAVPHWDVTLKHPDYTYECEVEYYFGKVIKVKKDYELDLMDVYPLEVNISREKAINLASEEPLLDKNASICDAKLDTETGIAIYKVYFSNDLHSCRIDVSATLGTVMAAEVVNRNFYDHVDDEWYISSLYPGGDIDNDMSQTSKDEAFAAALNHAALTKEDILYYNVTVDDADAIQHFDVVFTTVTDTYAYEIEFITGQILKVTRTSTLQPPSGDSLLGTVDTNDAAIQIAKKDPMLTDSITAITAQKIDSESSYNVRITGAQNIYRFTIDASYALVTKLEIFNRDYYTITDDIDIVINKVPSYDLNSNAPIARSHALKHAGLTEAEISGFEIELHKNDMVPHYEVRFSAKDFVYTYDIAVSTGYVLKAARSYVGKLPEAGDTPDSTEAARLLALADPLVEADAFATKVLESKPEETLNKTYFVYLTGQKYSYKLEVSVQYDLVYSIEVANRDYYPDFSQDSGTLVPPDGKIGEEIAKNYALLLHDNVKAEDVQFLECSEGMDNDKISSYYDVAFYHGSYKWHYYISMYSCELLGIDKIEIVYG